MDFDLSDMQRSLQKSITEFARRELNDELAETDAQARFPMDKWRRICDMEVIGIPIPEAYGGQGEGILTTLVAIEALGNGCRDSGLIHCLITQILCALQIAHFGDEKQKQRWLPGICRGEIICSQAITEPDAGSDTLSIQTAAERIAAGGYDLNGTKIFITNGPIADLVIVFAVTDPAKKNMAGISCLLVEDGRSGFRRGRPLDKMGLRTLQNGELVFTDCGVPAENLLGKEGQGAMILNEAMQVERTLIPGAHIGIMQRTLDACVKYANGRHQFGQPIGRFQAVSRKIAEMRVNLELGRLILYKAAWLKDQKKRAYMEASIAKLFISENLKKACLEAVQLHGAYGFMKEFELERDLRDSIAATLYSGTSEIQNNIISSLSGLK